MSALQTVWTAFAASRRIAGGTPAQVAAAVHAETGKAPGQPILIFDDATGRVVDVDLRGCASDVIARLPHDPAAPAPPRGPGRPKLGVIPREVTLLPRHWDWLAAQPGGASITLRRLVDAARKADSSDTRHLQERTWRAMTALAGDRTGYEEATRALFASDQAAFTALVQDWPADIAAYLADLSVGAFAPS